MDRNASPGISKLFLIYLPCNVVDRLRHPGGCAKPHAYGHAPIKVTPVTCLCGRGCPQPRPSALGTMPTTGSGGVGLPPRALSLYLVNNHQSADLGGTQYMLHDHCPAAVRCPGLPVRVILYRGQ